MKKYLTASFYQKHQTSLNVELLAGITSFLTMVYIAFVNPNILAQAGMDKGAVFTATCLVSALACALTGIMANTPIGVAPGMALNIYFTYGVVRAMHYDWRHALAMVFVSGILFTLVSVSSLRRFLLDVIPTNLQHAIIIGISLMIALIGLKTNHIVVASSDTLVSLGDIKTLPTALFFLGFLLILVLDYAEVKGAIVISILAISLLGGLLGINHWQGIIALPPSIKPTLGAFDFSGLLSADGMSAMFTFFLIAMFDASGTLIGLLNRPLFTKQANYDKRLQKSLIADAVATTAAGVLGSSSTSPFIESATGIESGGRTGLTAIVIAACFLLLLFFYPLAQSIPNYAVGPALLYVACCMLKAVKELDIHDMTDLAPAMVTIMMIPFTLSIANGLGWGVISYVLVKLLTRQAVDKSLVLLAGLFSVFFSL